MEQIDKIIVVNGITKVYQYKQGKCFPCDYCKKGATNWEQYYKTRPECGDCRAWLNRWREPEEGGK